MNMNIVSRKLIKPCIPTPQHLRKYMISYLDELIPPIHVGVILFYPSKPKEIRQLEDCLAKILPQFYPLAGRYIKKDHLVDCSDEGAEFVQAEAIDVELAGVVAKTTTLDQLNGLLPRHFYLINEAVTTPLLSVQATEFKCGGLVISACVAHRIFDARSVGTFIAAWTNATNPGTIIRPCLDGTSLLPWKINQGHSYPLEEYPNLVVKRFLFNKEAIARLRSKLKPTNRVVSRVRVVTAHIAKALIEVDRAKHGKSRACFISHAFDIRERTIPPLPKHSCGNFAIEAVTRCMAASETKDIGIQELVDVVSEATDKTTHDCAEMLSPGADRHKIIDDFVVNLFEKFLAAEVNPLFFSDWSKFGFYQADFGWGKPVWASIGPMPYENMVVLMDNKEGDGMEAWVHLNHNDMACFQQDEEIRCFSTSDN